MQYYVSYAVADRTYATGRTIVKKFNTKTEALKFAYQKARNFRSQVNVGRTNVPLYHDGQVICIKNKRFYITYNRKKDDYGREYVLHSDGTLGE